MTPLERKLVWLGYEDYTPLPQLVIEVDGSSAVARQVLDELLARGWVELYRTDRPLDNKTIMHIPAEDRQGFLDDDASWSWRDDSNWDLVWFATTDDGYEAYMAG